MKILMRGGGYALALRSDNHGNYLVVLKDGQVAEEYIGHEVEGVSLAINTAKAVFSALVPGAEDMEQ